ncbi:thiamine phosphate synthase [Fusobacterium massiliense]|uniref:thiamine phosphate synthase n=1 Tax=Fusobacterium massiliense TaxID=1852365 RepID=UPI0028E3ACED|nr:thiamine phosphate synthase [Fusobacterium massiliense]
MEKIKLLIISNRKLCKNENLEKQLEKIFIDYEEKTKFKEFQIEGVILREKDLLEIDYLKLLKNVEKVVEKNNGKIIIHKNYDILKEKNKNVVGLHLSFETFLNLDENKIENLRQIYGKIGVSVHTLEEAKKSQDLGANYIIVGHIFNTDCKKGLKPKGLDFLKEIAKEIKIEVFAIGGIDFNNYSEVIRTGVTGVCMMSGLMKY